MRERLKALGEEESFGEVASPSAGKNKQRQKSTREPGRKRVRRHNKRAKNASEPWSLGSAGDIRDSQSHL